MTHNYYYKHESQDNIVYIHCKWLNDVSLDAQPDLVICEISVSDTTTFWSNNVTMKDILRYRSLHIDVDLWKQLIQAALTGKSEFRGEPLNRKLQLLSNKCTISWISRLEGSIDLQVAELTLKRIASEEISNRWKSLLNALFEDDRQLRDSGEAMTARIKGLEGSCDQLKLTAEKVVRDKLDAELLLMDKFKLVLNAKKRKIKKLTTALQNADLLQPSASVIGDNLNSQALGSAPASASLPKSPNIKAGKDKVKRKRSKGPDTTEEAYVSQSQTTSKGKQKARLKSLSRTPSLEELMSQPAVKPSSDSNNLSENNASSSTSKNVNGYPQQTNFPLKDQSTAEPDRSLGYEIAQPSIVKDEHADGVSSLLDDDDLFFRPRMVKSPRKSKRV